MDEQVRRAMAPTRTEIRALPLSSNSKIVAELLAHETGKALDIGCGDGKFTRLLASRFAEVSGIDVKSAKIEEAKDAAKAAGVAIDFRAASGEAIPFADGYFDVVAFSNSLHHMPTAAAALREALRVLKPGGKLYVMEPVPSGNYHDATKIVNDETVVRTQAYEALIDLTGAKHGTEIIYRARREFDSYEEWKSDQVDRDAKRKLLFDQHGEDVRRIFLANAEQDGGKLVFDSVFRVNLLTKA